MQDSNNHEPQNTVLLIKQEAKLLLTSKPDNFIEKLKFLEIIKHLLKSEVKKTKREIFYCSPTVFMTQKRVEGLIKYYCNRFELEYYELNVMASLKGLFYGNVKFYTKEGPFTQNNNLIPDINQIIKTKTKFKKVLIVEKDSVFSFINQIYKKYKIDPEFLIVTGKGYPCNNTLNFLDKLNCGTTEFYGLFDFDPYGIDISRIYSNLLKKSYQRIGITYKDLKTYKHLKAELLNLKPFDLRKIETLKENFTNKKQSYETTKREYKRIIKDLEYIKDNKKCEIEVFTSFDNSFLIKYLKLKMKLSGKRNI